MTRKPLIPDVDAKSLSELAKQFPSTAELPAAAAEPVAAPLAEPAAAVMPGPAAVQPPAPVALASASAPPERPWHENVALRMAGVGIVAFLGGYLIGGEPVSAPPAPAPAPATGSSTPLLSTQPASAQATLDQERARAAAALEAARTEASARLAALRATRDRTDSAIRAGLALQDAAGSGRAFADELQAARTVGTGLAPLGAVLEAMAPLATGVPSASTLGTRFEALADSALTIGQEETPTSRPGRVSAWIGALFKGDTRAATVDRRRRILEATRHELARGDLASAATLAAQLDPPALGVMEGWIAEARGRLALDVLTDRAVALLTAQAYQTLAAN